MHLNRFVDAQNGGASHDRSGNAYEVALKEIMNGAKIGHWIWFVFPQGPFGESETSQFYAIKSRAEARDYLGHSLLRERLMDVTEAATEHLQRGITPEILMGSTIDCQKLASSLTLFHSVAPELDDKPVIETLQRGLVQLEAHGWPPCSRTLEWLRITR